MMTLPSLRTLIARHTLVAICLTLTVLLVGCGSYTHVRKGLTTDPSWKEIQQDQSQKVDPPKPIAGPKEIVPKAEEKEMPTE